MYVSILYIYVTFNICYIITISYCEPVIGAGIRYYPENWSDNFMQLWQVTEALEAFVKKTLTRDSSNKCLKSWNNIFTYIVHYEMLIDTIHLESMENQ